MKNKIQYMWVAVLIAFASAFAFSAFDKPTTTYSTAVTVYDENDASYTAFAPNPRAITKPWALDTITNAENDTLLLPELIVSPYQYSYQVLLANISGTRNIKFYLEQTSATASGRWMAVDSSITSGSTINTYLMEGANSWGNRHRIIVDGTGTQSVSYRMDGFLKPTN